jgi:predicted adenine nucleotide alpha hydrolase (AANH) superfamily ATPase
MHRTIKIFILWWPIFYFIILILMWHIFWVHIFCCVCVTNIMSSFQKSTMSPFFFQNSSIILKKIITKVYYNMDNEEIENFNVWYDFTF